MIFDLLLLMAGIAVLLGGAYALLLGSVTIALRFGISPVIVGATIVAFGTSAPELVVTVSAGLQGAPDVAFGNIVGSNIANVLLVLGLAAVINPLGVHMRLIRWEVPVLLAATAAVLLFALGGGISRLEGGLMAAGLLAFVAISPRLFPEILAEAEVEDVPEAQSARPGRALAVNLGYVLAGLIALAVGADWIVDSASSLAERLGASPFVIGVLIVAVGTSLPEIVTSAMAALRKQHEIAVANVVGSNIFNVLGVGGIGALIAGMPVDVGLYRFELPIMALTSVILVPLIWPRYHMGRITGATLLVAYAAFVGAILVRGG